MTRHYPDLGSASDWLNEISHAARPIRSPTKIWVVTRHQYGISALVSQTSFGGETSGSVAKCRLFSQATGHLLSRAFELPISRPIRRVDFKIKYFWNSGSESSPWALAFFIYTLPAMILPLKFRPDDYQIKLQHCFYRQCVLQIAPLKHF